jgi:hypothetical protein
LLRECYPAFVEAFQDVVHMGSRTQTLALSWRSLRRRPKRLV